MTGLRLMNEITDPASRDQVLSQHIFSEVPAETAPRETAPVPSGELRSPKVHTEIPIPPAPYLDRKVRTIPHLAEVWSYINPFMLYGRHLGFKGNFEKLLAERDPKALELFHNVEDVKREAAQFMQARAVWQFFEVERDQNTLHLFRLAQHRPLKVFTSADRPSLTAFASAITPSIRKTAIEIISLSSL